MINDIIDAICLKLNETFGEEHSIYTGHVKQGFEEPCFFVSCISPRTKQMVGNRYLRSHLFCIQFFPAEEEPKSECHSVLERFYDIFAYLEADGLLKGTGMHGGIREGVLSFFVNYDFFVRKTGEKIPVMGEMTQVNIDVKR